MSRLDAADAGAAAELADAGAAAELADAGAAAELVDAGAAAELVDAGAAAELADAGAATELADADAGTTLTAAAACDCWVTVQRVISTALVTACTTVSAVAPTRMCRAIARQRNLVSFSRHRRRRPHTMLCLRLAAPAPA